MTNNSYIYILAVFCLSDREDSIRRKYMKKFLLIAFTVLFAISLVACSAESSGISEEEAERRTQEKLDEAAETYGEFIKYQYVLERELLFQFKKLYSTYTDTTTVETTTIPSNKFDKNGFDEFVEYFYATEEYKIDVDNNGTEFVEGTYSGTYNDITISNVKITASYDIYSRTERDEDNHLVKKDRKENKEISISEFSYKATNNGDETNPVWTASIKATIDGTEYSIEYTQSSSNYTSASVNGKQVATKFLDAINTYGNSEWY